MTNLNDQFATPEAYVESLNTPGNSFTLVYSDGMGETAQDVADYLDMCAFSDMYKDVNGFRPRDYTLEQAREWVDRNAADSCDDSFWVAPSEGQGWSYNGSIEGLDLHQGYAPDYAS